jgi:hypothetical protein
MSNDGSLNCYIFACTPPGGFSVGPWVVDGGDEIFSVNSYVCAGRDGINCARSGSNCQCVRDTGVTATTSTQANCSGGKKKKRDKEETVWRRM